MTKHMLIDATHDEETRVVVMNGRRVEEYDIETSARRQLKGNIYLAKVIRIEPSLQAAFVDYGGNRHGFLAFSEIHPDYFQIPVADREKLLALQEEEYAAEQRTQDSPQDSQADTQDDEQAREETRSDHGRSHRDDERPETVSGENDTGDEGVAARRTARFLRNYRIQEVIRRRQIILVQVAKEERGNKGAALTTYISLPGRYCVLMPNALRGGGVSRKITSDSDRRRLRDIITCLDLPRSMAMIVRTAGGGRPGQEIVRDCDYLLQLWDDIRSRALSAVAPALVYEEASIIKRAIRDLFTRDIDDIIVDNEEAWKNAREFTRQLMPHNTSKVKLWQNRGQSLFSRYNVETSLEAMVSPTVRLESGGYIVINQTEALVAIDVNSGKSTSQRNIEETALRTNLEAAEEIARQLRLRDLAGLIVIDFIDMESRRHNAQVEKRLKDALRNDRARIQVGRISHFGLLEMSRQRLRPSLAETMLSPCPQCHGTGSVRGTESTVLHVLRAIEEEGAAQQAAAITVHVAPDIALYILNSKRDSLAEIEARFQMKVTFEADESLTGTDVRIERDETIEPGVRHTFVKPAYQTQDRASDQPYAERPYTDRPDRASTKRCSEDVSERGGAYGHGRIIDIEEADAPFIETITTVASTRAPEEKTRRTGTHRSDAHHIGPQRSAHRAEPVRDLAEKPVAENGTTAQRNSSTQQEESENGARRKRRRSRKDRGNFERGTRENVSAKSERHVSERQGTENSRAEVDSRSSDTYPQRKPAVERTATGESAELLVPGRRRTRLRRRPDEAHPAPRHVPITPETVTPYRGPTPADPFGKDIFDVLDTANAPDETPVVANERPQPTWGKARATRRRRPATDDYASSDASPVGAQSVEPNTTPVEKSEAPTPKRRARRLPQADVAPAAPEHVGPSEKEESTETAPRKRRASRVQKAEPSAKTDATAKPAPSENLAAPKPVDVDDLAPAKRRVGWWKR